MNKIILAIIVYAFTASLTSVATDNYVDTMAKQRSDFFSQLSQYYNFGVEKMCSDGIDLPQNADALWRGETRRAIEEARNPSYLKDLHCIMAKRIRTLFASRHFAPYRAEQEAIQQNINSFVILNSLQNVIYDKIMALAKAGLKDKYGPSISRPVLKLDSLGFLKVSNMMELRVEKRFQPDFPPHKMISSALHSLPIFQNELLFEAMAVELRYMYPYSDDFQLVYRAFLRIAERIVMIKFTENIENLFLMAEYTLRTNVHALAGPLSIEKDDLFSIRNLNFISNRLSKMLNIYDSNLEFFLIDLFSLKI